MSQKKVPEIKVIDNLEIHEDYVIVSVNPKIYTLDVVYSASYVLMDKAYIVIEGDPVDEILVEIRPKDKKTDLENLGRDFNNELINYAVYKTQSLMNQEIKTAIVKQALSAGTKKTDQSYLDDPEGIAVPWEEKFGKQDE